jgi:hypothetical protein
MFFSVETSYVSVEPKRKKLYQQTEAVAEHEPPTSQAVGSEETGIGPLHTQPMRSPAHPGASTGTEEQTPQQQLGRGSATRELRRARIVITVRRTESYKQWLEENPLQAIIAGDSEELVAESGAPGETTATDPSDAKLT